MRYSDDMGHKMPNRLGPSSVTQIGWVPYGASRNLRGEFTSARA
jgi:hypothetical protein